MRNSLLFMTIVVLLLVSFPSLADQAAAFTSASVGETEKGDCWICSVNKEMTAFLVVVPTDDDDVFIVIEASADPRVVDSKNLGKLVRVTARVEKKEYLVNGKRLHIEIKILKVENSK